MTSSLIVLDQSCLTNLLIAEEEIMRIINTGEPADLALIDFAKALDSVNHWLLCHKFQSLGVHLTLVERTRDFLTGRMIQEKMEKHSCYKWSPTRVDARTSSCVNYLPELL